MQQATMHSGYNYKKRVQKIDDRKLIDSQIYGTQYAQPLPLAELELVGEVHKDFCQSPAT